MKTAWEFLAYLATSGRAWLLPIAIGLAAVGGLIVLGQGSAIAPFIYTIF